jgi:cytoskeletal protein RodZ
VDQVNRPLLIALLATVVLAAGWMAFLRPAAVESTTKDVTAPARVATQARQAAAATDKASAATEAAADKVADESSAPASKAPAAPAPAATAKQAQTPAHAPAAKAEHKAHAKADPQAAVLSEMDAKKVVVMLFWQKTGADDRAARDAVQSLDRRDGKVAVHVIDVRDVGDYGSVTQGVSVTQSPTTIVISPNGTARVLTGLTDPTEVDQLVREALATKTK